MFSLLTLLGGGYFFFFSFQITRAGVLASPLNIMCSHYLSVPLYANTILYFLIEMESHEREREKETGRLEREEKKESYKLYYYLPVN
jgi:hypothetical protein